MQKKSIFIAIVLSSLLGISCYKIGAISQLAEDKAAMQEQKDIATQALQDQWQAEGLEDECKQVLSTYQEK